MEIKYDKMKDESYQLNLLTVIELSNATDQPLPHCVSGNL